MADTELPIVHPGEEATSAWANAVRDEILLIKQNLQSIKKQERIFASCILGANVLLGVIGLVA